MCAGADSEMIWLMGWKRFPASGRVTVGATMNASAAEPIAGLARWPAACGDLPESSLESLNIGLMCKTGCMAQVSVTAEQFHRTRASQAMAEVQVPWSMVVQSDQSGKHSTVCVASTHGIELDGGGPMSLLAVIYAWPQVFSCHLGLVPMATAFPWNS